MSANRRRRIRAWCLVLITIESLLSAPGIALANPSGGVVVDGSAAISHAGPVTTIDQATGRAIINWQGFSINSGELTQFNMPSASSAVLNRVTGGDPSAILGALQANGHVYLINPSGILFGAGAQVNVGSLVASTLDVPNAQFMQGGDLTFAGQSEASVVNYGNIRAITGDIYMIGRSVENHGVLSAPSGTVGLGAGDRVLLVDGANQRMVVQPSAASGTVTNTGTIEGIRAELLANGGNVYALAINNEGNVRATGAEITADGRVLLKANGGRIVNTGDLVAKNADGSGGEVVVDSGVGGSTELSGTVDVSGTAGGKAQILGDEVKVTGADVNADGTGGGGEVLIGGDYQGANPDIRNASNVDVDADSVITADARQTGDGGQVIVWSDGTTTFEGAISARGGQLGGNGGLVEVSGRDTLVYSGRVDTTAPVGRTGQLLLDPTNYSIDAGAAASISATLATTNVELRTADAGTEGGDIVFVPMAAVNWSGDNSLDVRAHGTILFQPLSGITHTTGTGSLLLRADLDADGAGTVFFNTLSPKINFAGSSGSVAIQYNPQGGYASPNNYSANVTMGSGQFVAQMLVNNVTDLQNMNLNLAGDYVLGTDIDASATSGWNGGAGFTPVGTDYTTPFTGTFDGDGHVVDGLFINRPTDDNIGLFGATERATIQAVGLVNTDVTGSSCVGSLVGYNYMYSRITNTHATGSVTGESCAGGLVGYNTSWSDIVDSYATTSVSGNTYVGGLVGGNNWYSSITNAHATGSVTGAGDCVGGLSGLNAHSDVTEAYAIGSVTGNDNVGGLVGYNDYDGTITDCYATGRVEGNQNIGGLAGYHDWHSRIENAHAAGSVHGVNHVGGLVGYNSVSFVTNAYATGAVEGSGNSAGGLVGVNRGIITEAYATGMVTGTASDRGGFVGSQHGAGAIVDSFWDTQTSGMPSAGIGTNDNPGLTDLTGLTTEQMMSQSNFATAGWDFANMWLMIEGNTRPFLRSEYSTTIRNAHQLQLMALDLSADYELATDIDMSELADPAGLWNTAAGFLPVGVDYSTFFSGSLAGHGYEIDGMVVNRPTTRFVGLFGYTRGATIRGVGLVNAAISGDYSVGGLVGSNVDSDITDSFVSGTVTGKGNYVGGLVGRNYGSDITNSYANGYVSGYVRVGGLVGISERNSTVRGSYATSNVTSVRPPGYSASYAVGGLVGENCYDSHIANSYATGNVAGDNSLGGLVGANYDHSTITNCYATGNVAGTEIGNFQQIGGLAGYNVGSSEITNCYATGNVSGDALVGGLVGVNNVSADVTNSYATGNVAGHELVGGLAGASYNGSDIRNSYATGNVAGTLYVGGLLGRSGNISVADSHATGPVSGTQYVGGFIGHNNNYSSITSSYATGGVTGNNDVGGFAGYNGYTSALTDAYATGAVEGDSDSVGGFVGYNHGSIDRAYSIGTVTDSDPASANIMGGFVGYQSSEGTIADSFWDTDTSLMPNGVGTNDNPGGIGLVGMTTPDMKRQANFTSATAANAPLDPDWDFDNTWHMIEGYTYPLLQIQPLPPGIPLSGYVYSDAGSTLVGAGLNVTLAVDGAIFGTTTTDATGQYTFLVNPALFDDTHSMLVYLNDNTGFAYGGASGLRPDTSPLSDFNIYGNTIMTRSVGGPMSNTWFGQAGTSALDSDIPYNLTGTNLVLSTGYSFLLPAGNEYTLDGSITTDGGGIALWGATTVATSAALSTLSAHDITVGGTFNWPGAHNLALRAGGNIHVHTNIQNAAGSVAGQGGALSLVAGWDGITGAADPHDFSLIEAEPASYGNNSGSVFIGDGTQSTGIAAGSRFAATQVAADGLSLSGSSYANGHAQLGLADRTDIGADAPITVRLHGELTALAGSADFSYVQVGHGGCYSDASHSGTIDVAIDTPGGLLSFQGGSSGVAYAQLGHGGAYAVGQHTGTIEVAAPGSEIRFLGGSRSNAYAQLGHGGYDADGNQGGAINVDAADGSIRFTGGSFYDAYAQLGHGGDRADGNHSGTIDIDARNSTISFQGGTFESAYAQLGHGGLGSKGNHGGLIDVHVPDGAVGFEGGSSKYTYAQLGHGGIGADGDHTGTIVVDASGGSVSLTAGPGYYAYSQIGLAGYGAGGYQDGAIDLRAGDLLLNGGTGNYAYTHIGHGYIFGSDHRSRQGAIDVVVTGETSLVNGAGANSIWWIGHRTGSSGVISNADITLLSGTLDYDGSTASTQFDINDALAANMAANLAGGNVTLGATNTTDGNTGGMTVGGPFSYSSANTLSFLSTRDLRFASPVQNGAAGTIYGVAGWNGAISSTRLYPNVANLEIATTISNTGSGAQMYLYSGGSIIDTATPVAGDELICDAAGTIGSDSAPLSTSVNKLAARAGGGIYIDNDQALEIAALGTPTITGVTTIANNGEIQITATGGMTVNETVSANGSGNVSLAAPGGSIQVNSGGPVTSGSGNIRLRAGLGVALEDNVGTGGNGNVYLAAQDGSVSSAAGADVTAGRLIQIGVSNGASMGGTISADKLRLLGAGSFTLNNADNDVTTLAAKVDGRIQYRDADALTVGIVGPTAGITTSNDDVRLSTGATLDIDAAVNLGDGDFYVRSDGGARQTASISASGLQLLGSGDFLFNHTDNAVDTLAALVDGKLCFANGQSLEVGRVGTGLGAVRGIRTSDEDVCLETLSAANTADLAVNGKIDVGEATIRLNVAGRIDQSGSVLASPKIVADKIGIISHGDAIFDYRWGNEVNTLAANTNGGDFRFDDADGYVIGAVSADGCCFDRNLKGLTVDDACVTVTAINRRIKSTGTLRIEAPSGLTQRARIKADELGIVARGDVVLLHPKNDVEVLAVRNTGEGSVVQFNDRNDLEIGTVSRGGCFLLPVPGILTRGGDVAVTSGRTLMLTDLIATELLPILPAGGQVDLSAAEAIVDNNDGFLPRTNVITGTVNLTADTGIGQRGILGAIDLDADVVNALNTGSGGIFLTSTRIGDSVDFASILAQGNGNVRLISLGDAILTDVHTDGGTILAVSLDDLTARNVATGNNNAILLGALGDAELGMVDAGNAATGGTVIVAAGENIVDLDGGAGEDVRGGKVNLFAVGNIGGSGLAESIEVRSSTVNAVAGEGVYVTGINSVVPMEFNHVISVGNGDVELRSRVDTTYNDVRSHGGDMLLLVHNADMTARDVSTTDDGDIQMRTTGPDGGNIRVTGDVSNQHGDIRVDAARNVALNARGAENPVSVTSQSGDLLVTGRGLRVQSGNGYDATLGSQHGSTTVLVENDVEVLSGRGVARIGSSAEGATGGITVWSQKGDVEVSAGSDRAAIGHAMGTGDTMVVAGRDLVLESRQGGTAQIGHDALPGEPAGASNVIVAWDQNASAEDGGGRLTMTENSAITGHGSPNQVRLFGTRRQGNDIAPGAIINGHPFSGRVGLFPNPPGAAGSPFDLSLEFFNWNHEQWDLDYSFADFLANPATFRYADHFMFYYVGPGLSPTAQRLFLGLLYGSDYDRFIRTQDWAQTIRKWLLAYGQPTTGSIRTTEREAPQGEIGGSGTGGVNTQGAE